MKKGIWIDTAQAFLVDQEGNNLEVIESPVETRVRVDGQGNEHGRFGDQRVTEEKHELHRTQEQEKEYMQLVGNKLMGVDEILVFGPAQMKNQLASYLGDQPAFTNTKVHVETADSMTDNQVRAYVRNYFK